MGLKRDWYDTAAWPPAAAAAYVRPAGRRGKSADAAEAGRQSRLEATGGTAGGSGAAAGGMDAASSPVDDDAGLRCRALSLEGCDEVQLAALRQRLAAMLGDEAAMSGMA